MKKLSLKTLLFTIGMALLAAQQPILAASTNKYRAVELNYVDLSDGAKVTAQPVKTWPLTTKASSDSDTSIVINLGAVIHPNLSGIGGAFNEQGGEAFMSLSEAERKALAEALFNPKTGTGLSLCRTAVGSSDFGLSAYSYSETPDDYEMKHFSVARDETTVLPFIRAAQAENPAFRMFASPWSPPGWMKVSGKMDGGKKVDPTNVLKSDPAIYKAYALYFSKYVQAYAEHGVTIERLIVQNETDMSPRYPGCNMLPEQMAELVSGYIRPQFAKDALKTEMWAGSFRDVDQSGARPDAQNFMKLEGAKDVDGVALQYCPPKTMKELRASHPELKMMHTEGACFNGNNSIAQARKRFSEIADWLNSGCDNYCYWNMVLNEESQSAWGWKQNSLVKIDRQAGTVTYNPDYAPVSLLSRFIRPGDQCLNVETPEGIAAIAVRNDSRLVVFLQNDAAASVSQNIDLAGQKYTAELPAQTLCAVVFKAEK